MDFVTAFYTLHFKAHSDSEEGNFSVSNEIDSVAYKLPASKECRDCIERKARRCLGGCIGYKSDRIRACNEAIEKL